MTFIAAVSEVVEFVLLVLRDGFINSVILMLLRKLLKSPTETIIGI